MKRILIEEKKNGWSVRTEGFHKVEGEYVFKAIEILLMIEFIGEAIFGRRVKVDEK